MTAGVMAILASEPYREWRAVNKHRGEGFKDYRDRQRAKHGRRDDDEDDDEDGGRRERNRGRSRREEVEEDDEDERDRRRRS